MLSPPSDPALEEPGLVPRACAALSSSPMAHSAEEGPSLAGERHDLAFGICEITAWQSAHYQWFYVSCIV